jgi:hypothetical protein
MTLTKNENLRLGNTVSVEFAGKRPFNSSQRMSDKNSRNEVQICFEICQEDKNDNYTRISSNIYLNNDRTFHLAFPLS